MEQVTQASPIIQVFTNILPLPQKEIDAFMEITQEEKLFKGDYWIRENKRNEKIAFIIKGYLRKFYTNNSGKEITDFFYFQSSFCSDLPSIIGKTLPTSNMIAMEETSLITFAYSDFDQLRIRFPRFERLYSILLELNFLRFYNRTNSFIQQSPKERYDELVATNPIALQKATQYHIASYLGISYQHLSRLRSTK